MDHKDPTRPTLPVPYEPESVWHAAEQAAAILTQIGIAFPDYVTRVEEVIEDVDLALSWVAWIMDNMQADAPTDDEINAEMDRLFAQADDGNTPCPADPDDPNETAADHRVRDIDRPFPDEYSDQFRKLSGR